MNSFDYKDITSRFSPEVFFDFMSEVLKSYYGKYIDSPINYYKSLGVKESNIPKGINLVRVLDNVLLSERGYSSSAIGYYLFDHSLINYFKNPIDFQIDIQSLTKRLDFSIQGYQDSVFYINNSTGLDVDVLKKNIIPKYNDLLQNKLNNPNINFNFGNIDTFFELMPYETENSLADFINKNSSLSILYNDGKYEVSKSIVSNPSTNGFVEGTNHIVDFQINFRKEPFIDSIISELEYLLNKDARENELESFIENYYSYLFGGKYDTIETQILLPPQNNDFNDKKRRIDIFMHNSVSNDWDLFEIKKNLPIVKNIHNRPEFMTRIYSAIIQLKQYASILKQDVTKEKLKKMGIEYFQPKLNLIVGRTPSLPVSSWQWLKAQHELINFLTWDDIINDTKCTKNLFKMLLHK